MKHDWVYKIAMAFVVVLLIVSFVGLGMSIFRPKDCRDLYRAHAHDPQWVNREFCINYYNGKHVRRCQARGGTLQQCRGY